MSIRAWQAKPTAKTDSSKDERKCSMKTGSLEWKATRMPEEAANMVNVRYHLVSTFLENLKLALG